MHSFKLFAIASLGLLSLFVTGAPTEALSSWPYAFEEVAVKHPPIWPFVHNNCKFSVYVMQTNGPCDLHPNTNVYEVKAGQVKKMPKHSVSNHCGMSVKLSRNGNMNTGNVYQVEYTIDHNGRIWYNFSHQDGNPFTDVNRFLHVDGSGPKCWPLFCEKGDKGRGCDWRGGKPGEDQYINDCDQANDPHVYLC